MNEVLWCCGEILGRKGYSTDLTKHICLETLAASCGSHRNASPNRNANVALFLLDVKKEQLFANKFAIEAL